MKSSIDDDIRIIASAALVRRQVEERLRRAIVEGRFAPGEHLSDRVIQDTFQVSRTVVREAVRQLEAEGLVETIPHRGSFVKVLSVAEAEQVYSVRAVLEPLAAQEFTKNASNEDIEKLVEVLNQIRAHIGAPQDKKLIDLKQTFYEILLRGGGNVYVQKMLNQLLNQNTQLRSTSLSHPGRLPETVNELQVLVEAIRRRDEKAAGTASLAHVENAAKVALGILRERSEAQARPRKGSTLIGDGNEERTL
jgi:DNA-binding GntR family transcriptional regulator